MTTRQSRDVPIAAWAVDAEELQQLLGVLTTAGVIRAKVPIRDGQVLEVEFAVAIESGPSPPGEEDMPWNARNPDEAIARANFDKKR